MPNDIMGRLFKQIADLKFVVIAIGLGFGAFSLGAEEARSLTPPAVRRSLAHLPAANQNQLPQPGRLINAGDYYLAGGKKIELHRSRNEFAVSYADGLSADEGLQALQQGRAGETFQSIGHAGLGSRGRTELFRVSTSDAALDLQSIASSPSVSYAFPVLVDPESRARLIPTDQILIGLAQGVPLAKVREDLTKAGLKVLEPAGSEGVGMYLLKINEPKNCDPLELSRKLSTNPKILWAEPNFLREIQFFFTPNDPLYYDQQYMHNAGQNGATVGADIRAPEAWDISRGTNTIVIAILDDGVDTTQPDLTLFTNPGESGGGKETNGIDDDGNGKIDDYRGWDFGNNDNNPNPAGTNGHGTACAGVAAAVGDNNNRMAGVAQKCKILPVKITDDSGNFTSSLNIGNAISYAAKFAQVLSASWGVGTPSAFIDAAITDATSNGRAGKGCPVFFATGDSASTWLQGGSRIFLPTTGLNGDFYFAFYYERGASSAGEDAARIDNVCLLDSDGYTHKTAIMPSQDFEGAFPPAGWSLSHSSGAPDWTQSSANPLTGTGGSKNARSPVLSTGQYAWLLSPLMHVTGVETLAFALSTSMPGDSVFNVDIYNASLTYIGSFGPWNGVPAVNTTISYPASNPNVIAVGASTDCDRRSDYSQYGVAPSGKGVDFVAPSSGGWNDIATLDPVGAAGSNPTDFRMNFGGTSSSCALAAGVGALLLTVNPKLTAPDVQAIMRNTCDKIGGVTYVSGTNAFYGYGRINAFAALNASIPPTILAPRRIGNNLAFSVQTITNRTYLVEYKDSLTDPAWQIQQSFIGNGTVQTVTISTVTPVRRFFRIFVQ